MSRDTHDRPHDDTPHPGRFLVFDGPDGGGKSTQITRLATWLRAQGHQVVLCRDPGGTPLGERLRGLLLDRDTVPISLRSEMLLYMASRAQLVDQIIAPALKAGKLVVSDRFTWANIVYQGIAGGLGIAEVARVGRIATGGLHADLTLILDLPLETAQARTGGARDRMEERGLDFHRKVREGFLSLARATTQSPDSTDFDAVWDASHVEADVEAHPSDLRLGRAAASRCVVIDASGEPDAVFGQIKNEVERVLAFGPWS
jgi:dTMP kinase